MKRIIYIVNIFLLLSISGQAQNKTEFRPIDQPDADGRIVRGREGTHHWQPYMKNADLSDYHHAPQEAVEQFEDMKYGLRIHWGIYSIVHGRESWILKPRRDSASLAYQGFYHDLYKSWDPYAFNANEWTDMMVRNGLKFFVFTTKHHDGFSMYDTKTTVKNKFAFFGDNAGQVVPDSSHYSIMETPFGRDVTAELIKSGREKGLRIGLYFSHPDWYDSDFRFDEWNPNLDAKYSPERNVKEWDRFKTRHTQQITELLSNYGKIDMLSFDMFLPEFAWGHMQEVVRKSRKLQPNTMLRWRGIGNYGDYQTPENYIPGDDSQGTMPWQVIHTLSTRKMFAYEPDAKYIRGGDWIVSKLIDVVSKGGSLQVGVGPDLTGRWHPKVLESLDYAGRWLDVNGEAIFKTRPCKVTRDGKVFFTRNKENNITYAITEGWPGKTLSISHLNPKRGSKIYLLGYEKPISWKKSKNGITLTLPDELQAEANRPCKQAFSFKIPGAQI